MPVEILISQNKVLKLPIVIINYCVIINVDNNFNCVINYWYNYIIFVVCFLLGNSPASECYIKLRRQGITQKKTYNFQNMAKVWNQEYFIFLIKASPEEFHKAQNVAVTGLLLFAVWKEDFKTLCPFSRIRPVTPRQAPNFKYPVNTVAPLPICVQMFQSQHYLVATVIHIQSLRSQICAYINILFTI